MSDTPKGTSSRRPAPKRGRQTHDADAWREELRATAARVAASMRLTSIGQLAAGVAHELNNPLSAILGFAQSALREPITDDSLRVSFKAIERETQRCIRLVQDLLNFSRLPRPGKVLEDPVQVVDGALTLVETQARIQNIELLRDFEADLPMIYVDKHRIQQAIINLCLNGMDAMIQGGRLTIRLARAPEAAKKPILEITVTDTGTGIAQEIRDHIFEPFFTTKEHGKGTGLGLSLVREVVKEHQGRLEIVSKLGEGTSFTLRLSSDSRDRTSRRNSPTNPGEDRPAGF